MEKGVPTLSLSDDDLLILKERDCYEKEYNEPKN
jgi:hypothetical protein